MLRQRGNRVVTNDQFALWSYANVLSIREIDLGADTLLLHSSGPEKLYAGCWVGLSGDPNGGIA